jgi:hypothetical protein
MKTKSVFSKIRSSSKLIDRFKMNEEVAGNESRSLFQDFINTYNEVVRSVNDFDALKKDLKLKQKALKESVTKLSKVRKKARKALRSSTKTPINVISHPKVHNNDSLSSGDNSQSSANKTKGKSKNTASVK